MTVGSKVFELRKKWNLSQEELAEKVNVSRQTISKWENDLVLPDAYNLKELAKVFHCTVDELIDDNKEVKPKGDGAIVEAMKYTGKLAKRHWQKGGYLLVFYSLGFFVMGMVLNAFIGVIQKDFIHSFSIFGDFHGMQDSGLVLFSWIGNALILVGVLVLLVGVGLIVYDFIKRKKENE